MTKKEAFDKAVTRSKSLTERPSNEDLLKLYSLFKQATEGDVTGERPGGFDFKGAAKFNAWEAIKGLTADEAMMQYIALVNRLYASE